MGTSGGHRVVVVGGGFGGLRGVRGLRRAPADVTLVDRQNFPLFQPLVYRVAAGAVAPAEIAVPLRAVFRRQRNVRVLLANVTGIDLGRREIVLDHLPNGERQATLAYDTLIVAGGARYSYFGHHEWQGDAPELKAPAGGVGIRHPVLPALPAAQGRTRPQRRRRL